MFKQIIAGAALLASTFGCANAHDAGTPALSWTGFYVGGDLGARVADVNWTTDTIFTNTPPSLPNSGLLNSSGFRFAGHAGYNLQAGMFVIGIEGDIGSASTKTKIANLPGTFEPYPLGTLDSMSADLGWDGSVRGRFGFLAAPSLLLYGTAGIAWQRVSVNTTCFVATPGWCVADRSETVSKTLSGLTLGLGAETVLSSHWLARLDYRHAAFGNLGHSFFVNAPIDQFNGAAKVKTDTLQVGLSYKF